MPKTLRDRIDENLTAIAGVLALGFGTALLTLWLPAQDNSPDAMLTHHDLAVVLAGLALFFGVGMLGFDLWYRLRLAPEFEKREKLAEALKQTEAEARTVPGLPMGRIYLSEELHTQVIAWSAPDDGRQFDSDRAGQILRRHLAPLGYTVGQSFVSRDRQDSRSYCHFFRYSKDGTASPAGH